MDTKDTKQYVEIKLDGMTGVVVVKRDTKQYVEMKFDDMSGDIDPIMKQKALELTVLAAESDFIDVWDFCRIESKKEFYKEIVHAFETLCEREFHVIFMLPQRKRALFPKDVEKHLVIYKEAMHILGEEDNYILRNFADYIEHFIENTPL